MRYLLELMKQTKDFKGVLSDVYGARKEQLVHGLSGSQKAYFLATLAESVKDRSIVVVTYNQYEVDRLYDDLVTFLPGADINLFPAYDILPHHDILKSLDVIELRMATVKSILTSPRSIVIVPVKALARKMVPKRVIAESVFTLKVGDTMEPDQLSKRLVLLGYERVQAVEGKREFSIRGGIVDIFPVADDMPVRIEFFDDEVDSIRTFDPESQRSRTTLDKVFIYPAADFLADEALSATAAKAIRAELTQTALRLEKMEKGSQAESLRERVSKDVELIEQGIGTNYGEEYAIHFYSDMASLLDYFSNPLLILDEPVRVSETLDGIAKEVRGSFVSMIEQGRVLPSQAALYSSAEEVMGQIERFQSIHLALLARGLSNDSFASRKTLSFKLAPTYQGNVDKLVPDIKEWKKKRYRTLILMGSQDRARRLVEVLREREIEAAYSDDIEASLVPSGVVATVGQLDGGFIYPDPGLVVLTEAEIQGKQAKRRRFKFDDEAGKISSYTDLKAGDYVVHVNHGVGKYIGVEALEVSGTTRDYLVIKYSGEDKLYVPTDQVAMLQKYIGADETAPKLNKLGGNEWNKVKSRVKKSVMDLAEGLIKLYAEREATKGHAFSPDTVWSEEFDDAFGYEETPDQWRAIQDVRRDMERERAMDRLICGDVGFGKTEVAMRAAFKCTMDEKQVAVLVPTTILAQQHYKTFSERFSGYPVNVAVMSRFQSRKEQQDVIRGLKNGKIDVVIGTHRLLQKDVKFKDLGLIVIDEEQRFGVAHKERLKELKRAVDCITLTATPIPRTLHMAMVGVRDISLIQTPPPNRYPIRTFVIEHDPNLIREVILREIERGGQVYFVHNRVQGIDNLVAYLRRLVPEATFGVAHGQMSEARLERTMMQFLEREFDVLVCTTIVESGLDISNVNTILIDDADQLGLAQLYQLRGRVGRTNRVAYCYLMFKQDKSLSEVAEKRLEAVREFTDLGSGFKIAMRDLEIRGAGNILGPEQHGHIASVGFEMYCRLLEEAIEELRGRTKKEEMPDPLIELRVDAFISDEYIPDPGMKIQIYKKINAIRSIEDASDVLAEITDRFGDPPEPVLSLLCIARIRVYCRAIGVMSIQSDNKEATIRLYVGPKLTGEDVADIAQRFRRRVIFSIGKVPSIKVKIAEVSGLAQVRLIEDVLSVFARTQGLHLEPLLDVASLNKNVN